MTSHFVSGKGPGTMVSLQSYQGLCYLLTDDIQPDRGMNQDLNILSICWQVKEEEDMSRDMRFPAMWHFDKCRFRRACAPSF